MVSAECIHEQKRVEGLFTKQRGSQTSPYLSTAGNVALRMGHRVLERKESFASWAARVDVRAFRHPLSLAIMLTDIPRVNCQRRRICVLQAVIRPVGYVTQLTHMPCAAPEGSVYD